MADGIKSAGPVAYPPSAAAQFPAGPPPDAAPSDAALAQQLQQAALAQQAGIAQGAAAADPNAAAISQAMAAQGQTGQSGFNPNDLSAAQQAQLAKALGAQLGTAGAAAGVSAGSAQTPGVQTGGVQVPQDFLATAALAQKDSIAANLADPSQNSMHKLQLLGAFVNWRANKNVDALTKTATAARGAADAASEAGPKGLSQLKPAVKLEKLALAAEAKAGRAQHLVAGTEPLARDAKLLQRAAPQRLTLTRSLKMSPFANKGWTGLPKMTRAMEHYNAGKAFALRGLEGTDEAKVAGRVGKFGALHGKLTRQLSAGFNDGRDGMKLLKDAAGKPVLDGADHVFVHAKTGEEVLDGVAKPGSKVYRSSAKLGSAITKASEKADAVKTAMKGSKAGGLFGKISEGAGQLMKSQKLLPKLITGPVKLTTGLVSKVGGVLGKVPGLAKFAHTIGRYAPWIAAASMVMDGKKALSILSDPHASLKKKVLGVLTTVADGVGIIPEASLFAGGASLGLAELRDHSK